MSLYPRALAARLGRSLKYYWGRALCRRLADKALYLKVFRKGGNKFNNGKKRACIRAQLTLVRFSLSGPSLTQVTKFQRAVLEAKSHLEAAGHILVPFQPPSIPRIMRHFVRAVCVDGGAFLIKKLLNVGSCWFNIIRRIFFRGF